MTRRSDKTNYGLAWVMTKRERQHPNSGRRLWQGPRFSGPVSTPLVLVFLPLWSLICYLFRLSPTVCDWTLMCLLKGIKGQALESSHPISSSQCPPAQVPQNTSFLQFRQNLAYRWALSRCFRKYLGIDRWKENISVVDSLWTSLSCVTKSEAGWHVTSSVALVPPPDLMRNKRSTCLQWSGKHLTVRTHSTVTRSSSAPSALHSWINDWKSDVCLHRSADLCVTERFLGILLKVGQAYCVCQTKIISRPFPLL